MKTDAGMTISVQNLRSTCETLRASIDAQKFNRILTTFKPENVRGLAAFHLHRAKAHPLAVEWHELMQAVDKSEAAQTLLLPERSFFLLDQLVRLKSLLDMPNIERILNRLETGKEYFSTMFEVYILSSYREIGAEIEILEESNVPRERRADFRVEANGQHCYVECKSLEDMSRKEEHLVHIEIPFKKGIRLLEVSDLAYQRVFGLLRKKRRLNAAVLSARTLSAGTKEGENPISDYLAIVPNPNPGTPLPKTFAILGTDGAGLRVERTSLWNDLKWWWKIIKTILANGIRAWPTGITETSQLAALGANGEGSLVIEFGINQPMEAQLGKNLLFYSSPDGTKQVRLWQSFANQFRADVVDPNFGRRTFKGDLNHLEVGKLHKVGIGWSVDGISTAVNGEMLEPIV